MKATVFNTRLTSSFDFDPESVKREMVDAMAEVEKWDLLVDEVRAGRSEDGFLSLEALPAPQYMPGGQDNNGFEPVVVHTNRLVSRCPECLSQYMADQLHPENGCPLGVIDHVLRS